MGYNAPLTERFVGTTDPPTYDQPSSAACLAKRMEENDHLSARHLNTTHAHPTALPSAIL